MQHGLVIVFTGDGKGKTSAALGIVLRACGHRMRVSMVQFIKSGTDTGEEQIADRLKPEFELVTMGKGFVHSGSTTMEEHRTAAETALSAARQRITSGYWDIVILDEINTAIGFGLVDPMDVLALIRCKPEKMHLVLTGRDAPHDIISTADLVTEMRSVKHPFDERRTPAQKGIDY